MTKLVGPTEIQAKHAARCHCGAVELELTLPDGIVEPRRCDCSMCRRRGAIVASVPLSGIRIVRGQDVLRLYQFNTCPFCIKTRQEMRRLSLPIEKRDAQHNATNRDALQQGSGATKVPCLKITEANGETRWLQDSKAIVAYLRERFQH